VKKKLKIAELDGLYTTSNRLPSIFTIF